MLQWDTQHRERQPVSIGKEPATVCSWSTYILTRSDPRKSRGNSVVVTSGWRRRKHSNCSIKRNGFELIRTASTRVYTLLDPWRCNRLTYCSGSLLALVTARSKSARMLGLRVRIPSGAWLSMWMLCFVKCRSMRWADHSSRGAPPSVEGLGCDLENSTLRRPKVTQPRALWGGAGEVIFGNFCNYFH